MIHMGFSGAVAFFLIRIFKVRPFFDLVMPSLSSVFSSLSLLLSTILFLMIKRTLEKKNLLKILCDRLTLSSLMDTGVAETTIALMGGNKNVRCVLLISFPSHCIRNHCTSYDFLQLKFIEIIICQIGRFDIKEYNTCASSCL
jgi:hypothetical protein